MLAQKPELINDKSIYELYKHALMPTFDKNGKWQKNDNIKQAAAASDSCTIFDYGNLSPMSDYMNTTAGKNNKQARLSQTTQTLASDLQKTLEIDELISLFSSGIKDMLPHLSLAYHHDTHHANDEYDNTSKTVKYTKSFELVSDNQHLGHLNIGRNKAFNKADIALLEHFLYSLIYPLRNALMYKHALIAALKDPLTGINNRSGMNSTIIRETELARRHKTPLTMISFDIDHFKQINDNHGHSIGDIVIQKVAGAATDCIRSSDVLFRAGGEEFIIMLSNTDKDGAILLAERIRSAIASTSYKDINHEFRITASFGVTHFEEHDNSESLYEKADIALYQAKSSGRNCVRFSSILSNS